MKDKGYRTRRQRREDRRAGKSAKKGDKKICGPDRPSISTTFSSYKQGPR